MRPPSGFSHLRGRSVDAAVRDTRNPAWIPQYPHFSPPPTHLPSPQDAYYSSNHQTTYAAAAVQHTPSYHASPHASLASPFSHARPAHIATFDIPTAPTPAYDAAGRLQNWSKNFADGLFDDIDIPLDPETYHVWPKDVSDDDDKLLVLLRCAKRLGFSSFPKAFAAYLVDDSHKYDTLSRSISHFFHPRSGHATTSPLDIVKLLTSHQRARRGCDRLVEPLDIQVPQYALPPASRLAAADPVTPTTQRNAIAQWAFGLLLRVVDEEADALLCAGSDFLRGVSIVATTWDLLRGFTMSEAQQTIATRAPLTFAVVSTIATNKKTRKRVEAAAATASAEAMAEPSDELSSSDEDDTSSADLDEEAGPSDGRKRRAPALGVPKGTQRDPWLGCTVAILLLLRFRNQYAIIFAITMAIFCFSCRAHKDLVAVLCHLGLTTSYSTIHCLLERLAHDKLKHLRALASRAKTLAPSLSLIYDNLNKMRRAHQSTSTNHDEMHCGTAGSVVELVEVEEGSLDESLKARPLLDNIDADKRASLTSQDLLDDIDGDHMEGVVTAQIMRQWTQVIPSLARFATDVDKLFTEKYAKRPLKLRKSTVHPLPSSGIDESTVSGGVEVVKDLLVNQLHFEKSWFENDWLMLVGGDQLTVDRLRKAKLYLFKATSAFERFRWLVPFLQLWHLKWNWLKAIIRLHWQDAKDETGEEGEKASGGHHGLREDYDRLKRSGFNPKTCDFYPADALVRDKFAAMTIDILRIICDEKSSKSVDRTKRPIEALDEFFAKGGPQADIQFDELHRWAREAYRRFFTGDAYNDALGGASQDHDTEQVDEEDVDVIMRDAPQEDLGAKNAIKEDTVPEADSYLSNSILFLRSTAFYLELCAAIADGDMGRVLEVLKVLLFCFWGAGSTNYGNELFEMACNLLAEFPQDLRDLILENYLVNPSGLPGHWHELDLLQEHINFWFKVLFNAKTAAFDSHFLSFKVGLNIIGLGDLRSHIADSFNIKRSSFSHTSPSKVGDINILATSYRDDEVHVYKKGRKRSAMVVDEFSAGIDIVHHQGKFSDYVKRTSVRKDAAAMAKDIDAMEEELRQQGETPASTNGANSSPAVPANPMYYTTQDGLVCTPFVVDEP
ncbi:hypothetical protein EV715DRAFT_215226 [Schizophyllum commune]